MDPNQFKEKMRLWYTSFPDFCRDLMWIYTKDKGLVRLELNPAQLYLYGKIKELDDQNDIAGAILVLQRWIVLKGRQMGISTMIQAYFCWRQWRDKGLRSKTLAHDNETTVDIFGKIKTMFEELPDQIKPATTKDTSKELHFTGAWKGTELSVKTGSAKTAGRGGTVQLVHISELAFWEFEPAIPLLGLRQSVPRTKKSFICIESTANGMGNHYHELWVGANLEPGAAGKNNLIPIFLAWCLMPEYTRARNEFDYDLTAEELMLRYEHDGELHPLTDEQLMFRRDMIAENGEAGFRQEYPLTPDEAFLATGETVFTPEEIQYYRAAQMNPFLEGDYEIDEAGRRAKFFKMKSTKRAAAPLRIWQLPQKGEKYILCNDVATGQGKDSSVFCILRIKKDGFDIVATYRAKIDAVSFAYVVAAASNAYNNSFLVLDRNSTGIDTINELVRLGAKYKIRMYRIKNKARKKTSENQDLGISTGPRNKTSMVERMANRFRNFEVGCWDSRIVDEMMTFVYGDDETGEKAQAETGAHDDFMMCLAIGAFAYDSKQIYKSDRTKELYDKQNIVRHSRGI